MIRRCSGSTAPPSRWARIGRRQHVRRSQSSGGRLLAATRRRRPAPTAAAGRPGSGAPEEPRRSSSAAVAALRPICPAAAAASVSAVRLAPGPLTSSSRWIVRVADEEEVEVTAVDAHRHPEHDRAGLAGSRPITRSVARIRWAARAAALRVVRPREQQQHRVATPLDQVGTLARGPRRAAPANVALSMSLISSAPTLPLRASRSVSRVKPEMSTKTRCP